MGKKKKKKKRKKRIKNLFLLLLILLLGLGLYVGSNWNQIMTGFMTARVDPSSQILVKELKGEFEATRYLVSEGKKGNESPLKLSQGMALKANDKIISGGNATKILLALDPKNSLELRSADFILKSLFGEESDTFKINVEEGTLFLRLRERGGRDVQILDTNKNYVETLSDALEAYLAVTSFEGTLNIYVKSGELKIRNSKKAGQEKILKAGMALEISDEGIFKDPGAEAEWVKTISW